jgi:8-amino-7-oxononanoate synthase
MGLFDRHAGLLEAYRDVRTTGLDPFQIRMERVLSPTEAIINGKPTLLVGTNNYFGLTFDPSCMEAAIEAIRAEGTGTTGSRIANGSYTEHVALEQEIAQFYGKKHCMVFTTGYQANLGVISTLADQGDFLLIDADSHASIYDACKMTRAEVVRFKHNDPSSLEARLRRLGDKPGNRVVVLEGIYSMLGDSAPLKEFIDVCKKYGAYVLVDEAHSLGALGAISSSAPFPRRWAPSAGTACRTIPTSTSCASPCAPTCSRPRCRPRSWPRSARRCAW